MTEQSLTDQIIQATPGRACTDIGCALCCKLPYIKFADKHNMPEKPAGKWCAQCAHPPTCDIYEDRPQVCRNFYCTWLGDANWPQELDPISTGCMIVTEFIDSRSRLTGETGQTAIVRIHESRPGSIENIDHALKIVWAAEQCAIALYTTQGTLRLIGYDQHGERVTFLEVDANPLGRTDDLPIITALEFQRWGWNLSKLSAQCARERKLWQEDAERARDARDDAFSDTVKAISKLSDVPLKYGID